MGTSHGNGLPLIPEGGLSKRKRSQNIVEWCEELAKAEDSPSMKQPSNQTPWECNSSEEEVEQEENLTRFKKIPQGTCVECSY